MHHIFSIFFVIQTALEPIPQGLRGLQLSISLTRMMSLSNNFSSSSFCIALCFQLVIEKKQHKYIVLQLFIYTFSFQYKKVPIDYFKSLSVTGKGRLSLLNRSILVIFRLTLQLCVNFIGSRIALFHVTAPPKLFQCLSPTIFLEKKKIFAFLSPQLHENV